MSKMSHIHCIGHFNKADFMCKACTFAKLHRIHFHDRKRLDSLVRMANRIAFVLACCGIRAPQVSSNYLAN